jgi:hypothetical protein
MKTTIFIFTMSLLGLASLGQNPSSGTHKIGEYFGGGIIFYVDETGEHGLIAAPSDLGKNCQWSKRERAAGSADLVDGYSNTQKIIEEFGYDNAAGICNSLKIDGFIDWYLPAQEELRMLYNQRLKIKGIQAGNYCSSSEYYDRKNKSYDCWVIQFGREGRLIHYHKKTEYFVRAIRRF